MRNINKRNKIMKKKIMKKINKRNYIMRNKVMIKISKRNYIMRISKERINQMKRS